MHTGKLVIIIPTLTTNSISTGGSTISLSRLVMLLLILLGLLRGALALVIELLILSLNLGSAVLGVGAAAASTVGQSVSLFAP